MEISQNQLNQQSVLSIPKGYANIYTIITKIIAIKYIKFVKKKINVYKKIAKEFMILNQHNNLNN